MIAIIDVPTEYLVEHGVPIPPPNRGGRGVRGAIRPWGKMGIGDSFFVPGGNLHREVTCVHAMLRSTGRHYIVRGVEGGVRVWRDR